MMTLATLVLAALSLEGVLWWLLVGLVAGWLANMVMRGGYGVVGDIIIGKFLSGGHLREHIGTAPYFHTGTAHVIAEADICIISHLLTSFCLKVTQQ